MDSIGVFGIVLFSRDSFSKNSTESGLGPSNIIVLRKIPKNTEPKIEVVIIKIDLAYNLHYHLHLIPRRKGDVTDPSGGIRNLIAVKGNWKNKKRKVGIL